MAYKITDICVACGTCIDECPVGAISEGDIYKIELAAVPALAPAPPVLSRRVNRSQIQSRKGRPKGRLFLDNRL